MRLLVLLVLVATLAGCGAGEPVSPAPGEEGGALGGHGLTIRLPADWRGDIGKPDGPSVPLLRVATFPLSELARDVGQRAQRSMGVDDILIVVADYGPPHDRSGTSEDALPLAVDRSDFTSFEGFTAPVATRSVLVGGRALQLWVVFHDGNPSDGLLARANAVIATFAVVPRRLGVGGLSLELPSAWDGFAKQLGPDDSNPALFVANVAWPDRGQNLEDPATREVFERLPPDGIVISAAAGRYPFSESKHVVAPPIRLSDGYFLSEAYEGQPAPGVSTQIIEGRVGTRFLFIQVYFGRNGPTAAMRAEADAVLATLELEAEPEAATVPGWREHRSPERGVTASYPSEWQMAERPLTNIINPREVLALATFPLRGGGTGGGPCVAAKHDLAALPPNGALIWLLEYRPARGDAWADLPRSRFPQRPDRFSLARADLEPGLCGAGIGHTTTFRDADRPFQLWLLAGEEVSDARLAEIAEILDSLRFDELPAPPPDPYAGWPLINDNPGDSLRPPPGWAAAAAMFPPDTTPRPRPLFFASNRPLFGLPAKLVPHVDRLPGPWPAHAVANGFPADAVLLWVLEEAKGGASAEFPPIDRDWPSADDFRSAEVLTTPNPDLRWMRAGGTFQGYHFSVWIAAGPEATAADRALAVKSAASLAVSGCWREVIDDCPDG